MAKVKMVQNDTAPIFPFAISRADGTIPNLTGATVRFIIEGPEGNVTNTSHQTCTITNAATGDGYYDFQTGDLPDAGSYYCDLQITYSTGKIETAKKAVTINARAEAA